MRQKESKRCRMAAIHSLLDPDTHVNAVTKLTNHAYLEPFAVCVSVHLRGHQVLSGTPSALNSVVSRLRYLAFEVVRPQDDFSICSSIPFRSEVLPGCTLLNHVPYPGELLSTLVRPHARCVLQIIHRCTSDSKANDLVPIDHRE